MSTFLNQPKGMIILGFTEIFERMSYYTLASLLVLYASASISNGGLGWTKEASLLLVGKYTLAAFTAPLLGGYLVDKFIGPFKASVLGGILITIGHSIMYFSNHGMIFFYLALLLVVTGTAFFKPSMPTLLGLLYSPSDSRRSVGFNIYYMCINIGSMIAGFSAGILLQHFGFQVALASAGIGMILGLITFLMGQKHLITSHTINRVQASTHLIKALSKTHKKALFYLLLSFIFYAIWALVASLESSGTLLIYIENYTQKTIFGYDIPTTFFSSLEPLGIIIFTPFVSFILAYAIAKKKPIHFFTQMAYGLILTFIAILYFTYLTYIAQSPSLDTKPFHFMGISGFILLISLSEIFISPVAMSAISILSPEKFRTSFQALNLSLVGFMGLGASTLGAISLTKPFQIFFILTIVTLIGTSIFLTLKNKMVQTAHKTQTELG